MDFESELFIGKIVCRFKGVTCPANPSAVKTKEAYFGQKRCTFQAGRGLSLAHNRQRFKALVTAVLYHLSNPLTLKRPPTSTIASSIKRRLKSRSAET
jgi:hypothetical protein